MNLNGRLCWLTLACLCTGLAPAQTLWTDIEPQQMWLPESASWDAHPDAYRLLELDLAAMARLLDKAPPEGEGPGLDVALPLPDGRIQRFELWASPVLPQGLAARFPQIRTFTGRGLDDPYSTTRLGITGAGFHAVVHTRQGTVYIDPWAQHQTRYYMAYYTRDVDISQFGLPPLACGHQASDLPKGEAPEAPLSPARFQSRSGEPIEVRIYKLALACTGEFAQAHGGTVSSVMDAFATAVNRINEIWEREVAIRLVFVENNDQLIFLDPNNDPFQNANNGGSLLSQNVDVLNGIIGFDNYDIGHIFTQACTDVGGVAGGAVCGTNKGAGVTCHFSSNIQYIAEEIMAHELAHQLSASHTWSNCPGAGSQLASGTAFEPGSGSTIMSYSGSCGDQNVQFNSDDYYHVASLEQIYVFARQANGTQCGTSEYPGNTFPELTLPYEDGFYIPIGTPFELRASATDAEGDALTYCWEEYDLGPISELGNPQGNAPAFRSFPPTDSPVRTFPRLTTILTNGNDITEVLPTYSRDLTFKCTVRDNHPGAGAAVWDEVAFHATAAAGPFRVAFPNTGGSFQAGQWLDVTWDVAHTDQAPVNCQLVNIRLSTDGGYTYPWLLASHVPNDGHHAVQLPDVATGAARIRVEAADNIFFDLSNQNFAIEAATQPAFTMLPVPAVQQVCVPDVAVIDILTAPVAGFDTLITLELVSGLPANVQAAFAKNPVSAGEATQLTLDMSEVTEDGLFEIVLRATAPGADTVEQTLWFNVVYNDFSALALDQPANGASGVGALPTFTWHGVPNAETYDIQIASAPTFAPATLLDEAFGLTDTSYVPQAALLENTLYYWRIRPANECGASDWLEPFAIHTKTLSCTAFPSNDVPLNIPSAGTPTVVSKLTILEDAVINDMNVYRVKGNHDAVRHIEVTLTSPQDSSVVLFRKICGNTSSFNLGFDDEAAFDIECPPNSGLKYKPQEPLSKFIGQSTFGEWKLKIKVLDNFGNGGTLEEWGIELCADFEPKHPWLVVNDTLHVPPAGMREVNSTTLLADDEDNTASELTYVLVTLPQNGTLSRYGQPLAVGQTFTQKDVNDGFVRYQHSGADNTYDRFAFTLTDGQGGFVGVTHYHIVVDPDAPVATREPDPTLDCTLAPNPTDGHVRIFSKTALHDVQLWLTDLQGRALYRTFMPVLSQNASLSLEGLPAGLYLLRLQAAEGVQTWKVVKR